VSEVRGRQGAEGEEGRAKTQNPKPLKPVGVVRRQCV